MLKIDHVKKSHWFVSFNFNQSCVEDKKCQATIWNWQIKISCYVKGQTIWLFRGEGVERLFKKIPAASQAKKKIHALPSLRKQNTACVVRPKKVISFKSWTIHPYLSLAKLSHLHTRYLWFNKARLSQKKSSLSSLSLKKYLSYRPLFLVWQSFSTINK